MTDAKKHSKEDEFSSNLFHNIMSVFVLPEIRKRQDEGKLPIPFGLNSAQIVFSPEGKPIEIRLNSEIKAGRRVKLKPDVKKKIGEMVYLHEIEELGKISLSSKKEQDCGHITMILRNDHWEISFDAKYNKATSEKHVEAARQFLEAAKFSMQNKNYSAFVDNLFSSAELAAKAILLIFPDPKIKLGKQHGQIKAKYNKQVKIGNEEQRHGEAFNKLGDLRAKARYLQGEFSLDESDAVDLLKAVEEMIDKAASNIAF